MSSVCRLLLFSLHRNHNLSSLYGSRELPVYYTIVIDLDNSSGQVIDLDDLSGRIIEVDNCSVINWQFWASVSLAMGKNSIGISVHSSPLRIPRFSFLLDALVKQQTVTYYIFIYYLLFINKIVQEVHKKATHNTVDK